MSALPPHGAAPVRQRRSRRAREVRGARASLVGSRQRDVRPAARDQSAAARLDRSDRRTASPARRVVDVGCGGGILTEAMAARGAVGARHRPRRKGAGRRAPAQARIGRDRRLSARLRRGARGRNAGRLRRRHLHGAPRARSRSRRDRRRLRERSQRPAASSLISTINRNPKAYALAILGAEYVLRTAAARHARLREVPDAGRSRAFRAERRSHAGRASAGITYNPLTRTFQTRRRHGRQLPDGVLAGRRCLTRPRRGHLPRALPVDAVLFDLDGTLADTAPDLGAALNRVRADRGLAPVSAANGCAPFVVARRARSDRRRAWA